MSSACGARAWPARGSGRGRAHARAACAGSCGTARAAFYNPYLPSHKVTPRAVRAVIPAMATVPSAVPHDPTLMAHALRALAMDAVQQANSGHPGAPMGMA